MIDFLIGLYLASVVSLFFTATLARAFRWYGLNALTLGLIAVAVGQAQQDTALLITGILTLVMKGFVIPAILIRTARAFHLPPYLKPVIALQHNMWLIPAILVGSWFLTAPLQQALSAHGHAAAISIATVLLALTYMTQHRHVGAKIVGFLMLENGLFLLGTAATEGMPMLVELGVLFDLMLAVIVINLLLRPEVRS